MVSGMRRVSEVLVGVGWSLRAGVARRSELQYGRVDGCAGVPQAGVTSLSGLCAREAGELGVPTVGVTVAERYQTSRVTAPLSDVGGKRWGKTLLCLFREGELNVLRTIGIL